jgi:hypothetical protein
LKPVLGTLLCQPEKLCPVGPPLVHPGELDPSLEPPAEIRRSQTQVTLVLFQKLGASTGVSVSNNMLVRDVRSPIHVILRTESVLYVR